MKKGVLTLTLFFILQANALQISDFSGVQIQFKQPISFALGKYAEDSKAQVAKGEVQYNVNYDSVIKAREEATSPFCTLSVSKIIKHKTQDYAQASNEMIEKLHQKKTILLPENESLSIKEASIADGAILFKMESKKENRILAECITPGAKDTDEVAPLIENLLETLKNNQAKLTKKGKEFPFKPSLSGKEKK